MSTLTAWAPDGVGEVGPGDDLAAALLAALRAVPGEPADRRHGLRDGDVVAVTSKVVSKSEGLLTGAPRETVIEAESLRVVARRGATTIRRTRSGLTLAAAGVDASNVPPGTVLPLPADPDASARRLRRRLEELAGVNVGVLVTDTAGRAWRTGQTDLAIGAAGLLVLDPHQGRTDPYGNRLVVTAPAVADELAAAAELVQGKLGRRPFAVLRGRPDLVLPGGQDGPGAAALVRPEAEDLFGYGAREAVVRAVAGRPADRAGFGAPAGAAELGSALREALGPAVGAPGPPTGSGPAPGDRRVTVAVPPEATAAVAAVAFAHGWDCAREPGRPGDRTVRLRLEPVVP